MWTLISGYIISVIFEYLTIKLHKNNLSNKNMSIFGIMVGWLFQEHVKQDFNMTGGKRFMLKRDFRNRFITQILKILRNTIFWIHAISIFELGTFLIVFVYSAYFLFKYMTDKRYFIKTVNSINELINLVLFTNFQNLETFTTLIFLKLCKILNFKIKDWLIIIFFILLFKYGFFKIYGWFDFFFIIRPFFFASIVICSLISMFWFVYLLYFFIIIISAKELGYIINILVHKIYFYIIYGYFLGQLIFSEINYVNITTENFFKELVSKLILFCC